jgi:hypothetical protein
MTKQCVIEGCTNEVTGKTRSTLCSLCRHGLYYWLKKRPAQVLERRRKLTMWGGRLDTLLERSRVTILRRRKS